MKPAKPYSRKALSAAISLLCAGTAWPGSLVWAAPTGGQIVGGSGVIRASDPKTTIVNQASQRLAVDWQTFNLSGDELVKFNQPSSSAQVLNRIFDQQASQIFGQIKANGHVFLLNPNGVIFGRGAKVNVGSLLVASANANKDDFMRDGRLKLNTGRGFVLNQGLLQASQDGSVTLLGQSVKNAGKIVANYGRVDLVSGDVVTLDFHGDGLMRFQVEQKVLENTTGLDEAISNTGTIEADGGQVTLSAATAKNIFSQVVNNEGLIRAGRIDTSGGKIRLVASGGSTINSGHLDATARSDNTDGGTIHVLGDQVALTGNSILNASGRGKGDGGTVLVGGDYLGDNPAIQNAKATYVSSNVTIQADAGEQGDGGKIIVWGDNSAQVHGRLSAKGGRTVGSGGFIETSGKYLDVSGIEIDASAVNGQSGQWLLDPVDITITSALPNSGTLNNGTWSPPAVGASVISSGTLQQVLSAGTSVTISTDHAGSDMGDITIQSGTSITVDSAGGGGLLGGGVPTLTLRADGSIVMESNSLITVAVGDQLNVNFTAGLSGQGNIRMLSGSSITTGGGLINLRGAGTSTNLQGVYLDNVILNATGGDIDILGQGYDDPNANRSHGVHLSSTQVLTTGSGEINIEGAGGATGGAIGSFGILIDDSRVSVATGSLTMNGTGRGTGTKNHGICATGARISSTTGNINLEGGGGNLTTEAVNISSSSQISSSGGSLSISVGQGEIDIDGQINISAGTTTLNTPGDITVDHINNDFNRVIISNATNVQLVDSNNINVSMTSRLTTLNISARGGNITQPIGSVFSVSGTTTLNASGGIALGQPMNDFNRVDIVNAGGVVLLRDVNDIELGGVTILTVQGPLFVTSGGNITNSGAVVVAGLTTLDATGNITLNNAANNFNQVNINNANDVQLVDSNNIGLGISNVGGNLTVRAGGDITDSGAVVVAGLTTLNTAGDITLGNANNNFNQVNISDGNDVQLVDSNNIDLGTSNVRGDLTIRAGGTITDSGAVVVAGTTTLNTTGDITLDSAANNFDQVNISDGNDVQLVDVNDIDLGTSNVGDDLTVRAGGTITDSGAVVVGGTTTLNTTGDITLDNAANNFDQVNISDGNDVQLVDVNDIDLGTSNVGGDLTVNARNITDSGAVVVAGTTTLNTSRDITLDHANNNFNRVDIVDARNATVVDVNNIDLGASNVRRNLTVRAGGDITDSGTVVVARVTTLNTAGDITLNNANNNFDQVNISDATDVQLVDSNDIDLGTSNVRGDLTVRAGGTITDSGAVVVAGTTTLNTTGDITLDHANNNFDQVTISNAVNVQLVDSNDISVSITPRLTTLSISALGGSITQGSVFNVSGTTTLNASGDITLDNANNNFDQVNISDATDVQLVDVNNIDLGTSNVRGDLTVRAGGTITDSGAVVVAGTTTLNTTGDITLDSAANNFDQVNISDGNDVQLVDSNNIDLGTSNVRGDLTVRAGGTITDSGVVVVAGTTTLNTAGDITLDNAANNFNRVDIVGARNATVIDVNNIDLGASNVRGDLTIRAGGTITDSGAVVVGGTTTLNTTGDITLDSAANNFDQVNISDGNDVQLVDVNNIDLGTSNVGGDLTVRAGGDITDSGVVVVAGTTTLNTAGDITLDHANNNFNQVTISNARNVQLVDSNDISVSMTSRLTTLSISALGGSITQGSVFNVSGTTTLNASGDITLNNANNNFDQVNISDATDVQLVDSNDIDLGTSNVRGDLTVRAGGDITDSGAVVVAGTTTLNTTGDITLDHANNNFDQVTISNAVNVQLVDSNDISVSITPRLTTLSISALGGSITQGSVFNVSGTTTLNASGDITLDNANNNFDQVNISDATDVQLVDVNDIDLGTSNVRGDLTVRAGGTITDSGAVVVAGTTTLNTTGDITLDSAANNFDQVNISDGNDVQLVDSNNIDLGTSNVRGDLTVRAGGTITDSGVVVVAGTTTLNTAGDITLDNAANNFNRVDIVGARNATVIDVNNIDLGASNVRGDLTIRAGGTITDSGAVVVGGTTTLNTTGDITLDSAANNFDQVNISDGNNVQLVDVNNIDLGTSNVGGDLTVRAGGDITDSGAVVVAGTTTLNTAGDITLDHANNNFNQVTISNARNVQLVDSNDISVSMTSRLTTLSISALGGSITQGSVFNVSGTTTLNASGDITLNNANNNFDQVNISDATDVQLVDVNNIDLGTSNVRGDLTVRAGGDITDSGAVVVAGTTTLNTTGDITLDHANNNFDQVTISNAVNVQLVDSNDISVSITPRLTTLSISALGGSITQGSVFNVSGTTTLNASGDITLDNANNNFDQVNISDATDVQLVDVNNIDLGTSNVRGDLTVRAGGTITDSGAVVVAGTTTLNTVGDITLDNANNNFDQVNISDGNDVQLVDVNDIDLGTSNVRGDLTVRAGGTITDSGVVVVAGTTTLNTAGDITLDNAANNFNRVDIVGARNATVIDVNNIDLGASNVRGDLTIRAGGTITDSGAVVVGGTTTLNTTGDITLDSAANNFDQVNISDGNDVQLVDVNDIDLGTSNVGGDLTVRAGGDITDSGAVVVAGTTTLNTAGDITLDHANNNFNQVTISNARNVQLVDSNDISVSMTSRLTTLSISALGGSITQGSVFNVSGTTTLNASGDITLNNANNNFDQVNISDATDVQLVDVNNIDLGTSNVGGDLTVRAGGDITDSGAVVVAGTTTLNTTGDITLDHANNNFDQVTISNAVNVQLVDSNDISVSITPRLTTLSISALGGSITQGSVFNVSGTTTLNASGDITLDNANNNFDQVNISDATDVQLVDVNNIDLGTSNVRGDLTVRAGGTITDSGAVIVAGTTTLNTTGDITLDSAANNFDQVNISDGNDVQLVDSNNIDLGTSNVRGDLTVRAGGTITDSGVVVVAGTTTLNTAGDITLDNAANNFNRVDIVGARNATVIDVNNIDLGASNVRGDLTIRAGGTITDSGAVVVGGTTTLNTTGDITLDNAANNFDQVNISDGNDVQLVDVNDIDLGTSNVGGDLTVNARNITDSGAVVVAGTTTLNTAGDITLDHANNNFNQVTISNARNVQLVDSNDISVSMTSRLTTLSISALGGSITQGSVFNVSGTTTLNASGDITLNNANNNFDQVNISDATDVQLVDSNDIDLGTSNVRGDLTVRAGGDITDSGAVVVAGTTTLNTTGDITLDHANNNFDQVTISNAVNVQLVDSNDISVSITPRLTTLSISALGGSITQGSVFNVSGTTTLNASGDITLDNANNNFDQVNISDATDVQLVDVNNIDLGTSNVRGDLTVRAGGTITDSGAVVVAGTTTLNTTGDITLDSAANNFDQVNISDGNDVQLVDSNNIDLGTSNVRGDLTVRAGGTITDSGVVVVAGTTTLNTAGDITLDNAANNFNRVDIVGARNATVIDVNNIDLGASNVRGDLTIRAGGTITDSGAVVVGGTTTLNTTGDITLDNAANNFDQVNISDGNDVQLVDVNDIDLGTSNVGGDLTVRAGGDITDSGAVVVAGTTTLNTAGDITLDHANNNFNQVNISDATDVQLVDVNNIDLGISNVRGDLTVRAGGTITDSGAVVVAGTTTLNTAGDITLDNANNNFDQVNISDATDVQLVDVNNIDLGTSNVRGDLTVRAGGTITDSGAVVVAGTTTLNTTGDITLDSAANNFDQVNISDGNDVQLVDVNNIDLGTSNVGGDLTVRADGTITDSGVVVVAGTTTLNTAGDITLDSAANNFNRVDIVDARNATVIDVNNIDLGASNVRGDLTVRAGGTITDSGAVVVGGTTTLNTTGDITLDSAANNFDQVNISDGNDVQLVDVNDIDLGTSNVGGDLTVRAGGDITDSGAVVVAGTTTLNTAGDITLDHANNNFNQVTISNARNVQLVDSNDISVSMTSRLTTLSISALGGSITQGSVFNVSGTTTLNASGDITLNNANNNFDQVNISDATDVQLVDSNDIDLGTSNVRGDLTVRAGGDITDSGAVVVAGTTTLNTTGDITLDHANNNFDQVTISNAVNVQLVDSNDISVSITPRLTTLSISALGGSITQGSVFNVSGTTTLNASGDITLDNANNNFDQVNISDATDVQLVDVNDIDLGTSNVRGDLTVRAGGTITDSGAVVVAGTTTLNTTGDITLDSAANNFDQVNISDGNDVQLVDSNNIDLGTSNVRGDLTVRAGGTITDSGVVVVAGTTTLNTAGDITLDNAANNFNRVDIVGARNATVIDVNNIDLGASNVRGDLTIRAGGTITDSGAVVVGGTTTLNTTGDITLDNAANNFDQVNISDGNNVQLVDSNNIDLGTSTVSGNLSIKSRDISFTGNIRTTNSSARLSITPINNNANIGLGDNATCSPNCTMHITTSDWNAIQDGWGNIAIGAADADIFDGDPLTIRDPLNLCGTATISASHTFDSTGISPGGSLHVEGTTLLIADDLTGDSFSFGDVIIMNDLCITASSGDIVFSGRVSSEEGEENDLTINASPDGELHFLGDIGTNFTSTNGRVRGSKMGDLTINGSTSNVTSVKIGSSRFIANSLVTHNNIDIASAPNTSGVVALPSNINAINGNLTFSGNSTLATADGNLTITAREINFRDNIKSSSTITLKPVANGTIAIGGSNDNATDGVLEITDADLSALGQSQSGTGFGGGLVLQATDIKLRSSAYFFRDPLTIKAAQVDAENTVGDVVITTSGGELNWYIDNTSLPGSLTINSVGTTVNLGDGTANVSTPLNITSQGMAFNGGTLSINQDVILTGNSFSLSSAVVGTGRLALVPAADAIPISINGGEAFNVNTASFSGFNGGLIIGGVIFDDSGKLVTNSFSDSNVNITATNGTDQSLASSIVVSGPIVLPGADLVLLSDGDITIDAITASANTVSIVSRSGSLSNRVFGSNLISASAVNLVAKQAIGTVNSAIEIAVASDGDAQFATEAAEAFINNRIGGVASATASVGAAKLGETFGLVPNLNAQALNTASLFASARVKSNLEDVAFIDVRLFDEDLELFGRVGIGIALPETQSEDYLPPDVLDDLVTQPPEATSDSESDSDAVGGGDTALATLSTEPDEQDIPLPDEIPDTLPGLNLETDLLDETAPLEAGNQIPSRDVISKIDPIDVGVPPLDEFKEVEELIKDSNPPPVQTSGCTNGFLRDDGVCVLDFGYRWEPLNPSVLLTNQQPVYLQIYSKRSSMDDWAISMTFENQHRA